MSLTRRTQILLSEDQHRRLRERSDETGRSVGSLIRFAIDETLEAPATDREAAGRLLLGAEPMEVAAWSEMKSEMLDQMYRVRSRTES